MDIDKRACELTEKLFWIIDPDTFTEIKHALQSVRDKTIEEAAEVCDSLHILHMETWEAAKEIRALKERKDHV